MDPSLQNELVATVDGIRILGAEHSRGTLFVEITLDFDDGTQRI